MVRGFASGFVFPPYHSILGNYMSYNKQLIRPYMPRGVTHYRSIFSEKQVIEIRNRHHLGESYSTLAKAFNTRSDTIRNLSLGYTYANIGGPRSSLGNKGRDRYTKDFIAEIKMAHYNGMSYKRLCQKYRIGMVTARRLLRS